MISVSRPRTSAESSTTTTRDLATARSNQSVMCRRLCPLRQNRLTEPPLLLDVTARSTAALSYATSASLLLGARRLTIALPLTGRKQTLRGQMSITSLGTTVMCSVFR